MDYYLYNVELPFSNVSLNYRQFTSKEQLILSKANILLPSDEDSNIIQYSKILQKIILNCIENKEDFKKIDIIEYILLLLKMRIVNIGNDLELHTKENDQNIKSTISLNDIIKNIYDIFNNEIKDNILEYKNIKIILGFPYIKNEVELLQYKKDDIINDIINKIPFFIKRIIVENNTIETFDLQKQEIFDLYENLPIILRDKIAKKILDLTNKTLEKNIFNLKYFFHNINLYNQSYQSFIRLFLTSDLREIYQDYYVLASKNINPLYVDTISISERIVFREFIKEEFKEIESYRSSFSENSQDMTPLEGLMDEFSEY